MIDREELGQIVRKIWVDYCKEIGDEKHSHITHWEELDEIDKEGDRCIGEGVAKFIIKSIADKLDKLVSQISGNQMRKGIFRIIDFVDELNLLTKGE